MTDNMQVSKEQVYCPLEGCTFRQSVKWAGIPAWHKKPCPTCGKGEIVTDEDLKAWQMLDALMKLANMVPTPDGPKGRITLHVNTGPKNGEQT